jgi:hypothetical protein
VYIFKSILVLWDFETYKFCCYKFFCVLMQVSLLHLVCVYSILSFWAWILTGLAISYILWFKCDMSFRIILYYLICVWKMIVISTNMVAQNIHFCCLHNNWQVQVKWCYGFVNSAIWQSCFLGKKSHKRHTNSLKKFLSS